MTLALLVAGCAGEPPEWAVSADESTPTITVVPTDGETPEASEDVLHAQPTATSVSASTVLTSPAPPADARPGEVSWVFDGDSMDVDFTDDLDPSFAEVRLIGVNAPEGSECLGDAAKDALIARVGRESVLIVANRWDEFGRQLAYVWHDGELINLWLVEQGLAVSRSAFGHDHDEVLDDAEAVARASEVGLWAPGACGDAASTTVSIAEVNFDAAGRDDENPNGEWIDLVNTGPEVVDLTGWTLRDESTRHRYSFESFSLPAEATVRLRSGCGLDSPTDLFWCDPDGTVWSNSGDTAFVYDSQGALVDTTTWDSIYDS